MMITSSIYCSIVTNPSALALGCRDLEELHQEFHLAVGRLRQKSHLVKSFFAQAGLKL
jgi:hypothetical protein